MLALVSVSENWRVAPTSIDNVWWTEDPVVPDKIVVRVPVLAHVVVVANVPPVLPPVHIFISTVMEPLPDWLKVKEFKAKSP